MHRSIAGHNPYNLFILTIYCNKNFTTRLLLTIEHISKVVAPSIVIQNNGPGYGSINFPMFTPQAGHRGAADVHGEREAAIHVALCRALLLPVLPVQERGRTVTDCADTAPHVC